LDRQTRRPDSIVVVDNASTDETASVLGHWQGAGRTTITMDHNVGGAGGFYRGMRFAYDQGADWVWMMDDDGVPAATALE
ncbi:glycosyltransferase, partial [Mycobacterium tuberculosis]|nr:glycosyltransferase [Mycobacterium tuberculosis]